MISKRILTILIILLGFSACESEKDNFTDNEWILHYIKYDNDYKIQEKTRTLFRNDSVISYSELEEKEIAFPLIKKDSTIIIKQKVTISDKNDRNRRDTLFIDTLLFDFKYIVNKPVLLLKGLGSNHVSVLTCANCENSIRTTSNFFNDITSFKIGGITIGDTLQTDRLVNIEECSGFDEKGLFEANLADNENILVKLISKNIVFSIEQEMIAEESVNGIIEVIQSKTDAPMDTIIEDKFLYRQGFSWTTGELDIELIKENRTQYYLNQAENEENEYTKRIVLSLAAEYIGKDKYWTLNYDNKLLQKVLKYHQDNASVSTIIE